ncbi:DUF4397 domain-containing protein [Nocardioides sp.]|uniref:DUF4397 domain-containing protein n=1 Tax=Nocardioides sp. TaxID=35761 RepID=UPI002609A576|nr:DUF4397 domain-containing protein [Nocardioides sp.]
MALLVLAVPLGPPGQATAPPGQVTVVQALPGVAVDVSIDGRSVATGAGVGDLLGPFDLAPGEHDIEFTGADDLRVASTLDVSAGASSDVVLHLPAEVDGDPVVHSYDAPTGPIGPDKARVVLAHTATVAPADVEVDGTVVFTNIANGEFAEADVPAGTLEVALLPSGTKGAPILGPLDVTLEGQTLSMIYAYGNPRDKSMNVISHTTTLSSDGAVVPNRIDTGSAGLVRSPVDTFGTRADDDGPWPVVVLGLLAVGGTLSVVALRRRRAADPPPPPAG